VEQGVKNGGLLKMKDERYSGIIPPNGCPLAFFPKWFILGYKGLFIGRYRPVGRQKGKAWALPIASMPPPESRPRT
jgi:hypothetical protein